MGKTALNDMSYNFEPLKLFERNPNYKVDERELKESIEKSKELIARLQKKKQTVKLKLVRTEQLHFL